MLPQNKSEFDKLNISYWRDKGFTGKDTTMVVLDLSGQPYPHNNTIEPLRIKGKDEGTGHKTYTTGVIREILPDAKIVTFHIGFKDSRLSAIEWIKENKKDISAISISVTGMDSTNKDLEQLKDLNIPIFASSGNFGKDNVSNTSKLDFMFSIGAWEEHADKKADYSNYGKDLDFVTYTNIFIKTNLKGNVFMFSGTSCSTPVAASLIALANENRNKQGLSNMTRQEAFEFMLKNVDDKETPGRDDKSGYGLVRLPSEIPTIEKPKEIDTMKFKDTNGHWAEGAIDFVSDKGLLKGYEDGTFKPERAVTRAELATVLARQNGYVEKK